MIYISGRITGNKKWQSDFKSAENFLISLGYEEKGIINPLDIDNLVQKETENPTYKNYMVKDIMFLTKYCDSIYMLRGGWRSKGARLEYHIAKVLGLKIFYQKKKELRGKSGICTFDEMLDRNCCTRKRGTK